MQYLWYGLYSVNMKGRVRLHAILGSLRRRPPFAVFPCTGDVAGINRALLLQKHCTLQWTASITKRNFRCYALFVKGQSVSEGQGCPNMARHDFQNLEKLGRPPIWASGSGQWKLSGCPVRLDRRTIWAIWREKGQKPQQLVPVLGNGKKAAMWQLLPLCLGFWQSLDGQ